MSIYQRLQREANHQAAEIQRMWDEEDDDDDDDLAQELLKRKRNTGPRKGGTNQKGRPDYWDSPWGIMLRDPNLQKVGSPERKAFTRRFRTPYQIYKRLVHWAKGWHEKKATDCTGRARCPTELKVLGYLRMTGRAACFDDVEELSFVNESTMHAFFHKFSEFGRAKLYPVHVSMPTTVEELAEIEAAYAMLGIPGAGGSMDVVHIALGSCPFGLSNLCTGKEGFPSLGYNMISDHRGRALALMPGTYGSINDQTIVKYDQAVKMVKTEKLFTEYMYEVRNELGERSMEKGIYLIVDGGYLKWEVLQCGLKHSSEPGYSEWRKRMESVRKDIECYFGRLKQRFKVLKIPNNFRKKKEIDDMMFTLVALQNMILQFDVEMQEFQSWDVQLKWQSVNISEIPEENIDRVLHALEVAENEDVGEECDPHWFRPKVLKIHKKGKKNEDEDYHDIGTDFSFIGLRGQDPGDLGWVQWGDPCLSEKERFSKKQNVLVKHYTWYRNKFSSNKMWLRS